MKSCKQCDEYDVCSRQNDLRRKKPRCPKAKVDKPMTNYDRLISKTPEEMAKFLHDMTLMSQEIGLSVEWWEQWLKSPVEVDK